MTQLTEPTSNLSSMRQQLVDRLAAFRNKIRTHLAVEGLGRLLAVIVVLSIVSLVLDRWLRLSVPTRITLLILALGFIGYLAWRWLIFPLMLPMDYVDLAAAADRAAGHRSNGNGAATNGKTFALAPRVAT